jgi:hypothetical protein
MMFSPYWPKSLAVMVTASASISIVRRAGYGGVSQS